MTWRSDIIPVLGALGFAGLLAVLMVLLNQSSGPVLWDDEGTYLWVAAGFARGDRWMLLQDSPLYSAGYSVVLAPFVAVLGQSRTFEAALLVNGLALISIVLSAWWLARRWFDLEVPAALVAVGVAVAYPSVGMQLVRAWPEMVLTAASLGLAVALALYVRSGATRHFVVLVVAAVFAFAMHKRMLAPVLLLGLAPLLSPRVVAGRTRLIQGGIGLATVPLAFVGVARVDALALQAVGGKSRENKVTGGLAPGEWLDVATSLLGQIWSLQIASIGLAGVALGVGVVGARGVERRWAIGVAAALVLSAGITSSFLRSSPAVDHVFYTRYLEVFGPLLALWAVASIVRHPQRSGVAWVAGVVVAAAGVPFIRWFRLDDFESGIVKIRIAGLLGPNALIRDFGAMVSLVVEVAALTAMLLVVAAVGRWALDRVEPTAVAGTALLVLLAMGVVGTGWSMRPWLNIAEPTGASAAATLVDQGAEELTVITIGDAGPSARAIAHHSDYRVQPITMTPDDAVVECPTTRFVLVHPGVVHRFEGKQVGDTAPFQAQLLEVLSCSG